MTVFSEFDVGGLSPLARGTLTGEYQRLLIERFIPASAGNTRLSGVITMVLPVYPR